MALRKCPLGRRRQGLGRASPLQQPDVKAKSSGVQLFLSHIWEGHKIPNSLYTRGALIAKLSCAGAYPSFGGGVRFSWHMEVLDIP